MPNTPTKTIRSGGADPRNEILFKVYSNFAGIGTDVADMIADCAQEPALMRALLDRLKIECAATKLDGQLKALADFASEVGETQFVMRVRHEVWKVIRNSEQIRNANTWRAAEFESKPELKLSVQADLESREPVEVEPSPTPSIVTGEYTGPDRRRLVGDRRSQMDRRGYPEGMGVDKRSGRDRRKRPYGRRKSDADPLM